MCSDEILDLTALVLCLQEYVKSVVRTIFYDTRFKKERFDETLALTADWAYLSAQTAVSRVPFGENNQVTLNV